MITLSALLAPSMFLKLVSLAFLSILFLQSGLDKVFNYSGNLEYFRSHFAKSPLKNTVGLLMPTITLLEVAAGVLSAVGVFMLLLKGDPQTGLLGAQLAALSITALFFGQRIAKDYAGAGNLVGYFLVCLASIYLLGS
ncbi:MAG: DoxX family protein [Rhodothermales bacterium]